MKKLPDPLFEQKAERHRKWFWCRNWNNFPHMPEWRLVAQRLGLPVHQVVAFVYTLDCLANAAEPRGYVGDFSAAQFATALDMSKEDASAILAALRDDDVRWIDGEHLASFHKRNPDREDLDAAERQRRSRTRKEIKGRLEKLQQSGHIPEATRWQIAGTLDDLPDDQLELIKQKLRRGDLTGLRLSTEGVSHVTSGVALPPAGPSRMSHVTSRDIVTVTPRAEQSEITIGGDKSAEKPPPVESGGSAGTTEDGSGAVTPDLSTIVADATSATDDVVAGETASAIRWLDSEGARIVTERMNVEPPRAALLIARWRRDLDDPLVLVDAILGADRGDVSAGRFHVLVTDQLSRHLRAREQGLPLPLRPVPVGAATAVKRSESPAVDVPREEGDDLQRKRAG